MKQTVEDRKQAEEDRKFWRSLTDGKDEITQLGPLSDAIRKFAEARK